jgi:hypothetical protein
MFEETDSVSALNNESVPQTFLTNPLDFTYMENSWWRHKNFDSSKHASTNWNADGNSYFPKL